MNVAGPDPIDTAMIAGVNANPNAMKMVMSRIPMGRMGTTLVMGDTVVFLASEMTNHVTGETVHVDGCRLGPNCVALEVAAAKLQVLLWLALVGLRVPIINWSRYTSARLSSLISQARREQSPAKDVLFSNNRNRI